MGTGAPTCPSYGATTDSKQMVTNTIARLTCSNALFFLLLAPSLAHPATATFSPAADTTLFAYDGGNNNLGISSTYIVGGTDHNGIGRALLRFDLSTLPPNAQIQSASLAFRVVNAPSGPASTFALHRMLKTWNEGTKGGVTGAPATAGESTWNHQF